MLKCFGHPGLVSGQHDMKCFGHPGLVLGQCKQYVILKLGSESIKGLWVAEMLWSSWTCFRAA